MTLSARTRGVVLSLGRWASLSPTPFDDAPVVSADSIALALRGRFDPATADGIGASYELRLGDDRLGIDVTNSAIAVARSDTSKADTVIDTDPETIATALWGDMSLAEAQGAGRITIHGDLSAVDRFVRLFGPSDTAPELSHA